MNWNKLKHKNLSIRNSQAKIIYSTNSTPKSKKLASSWERVIVYFNVLKEWKSKANKFKPKISINPTNGTQNIYDSSTIWPVIGVKLENVKDKGENRYKSKVSLANLASKQLPNIKHTNTLGSKQKVTKRRFNLYGAEHKQNEGNQFEYYSCKRNI